MIYRPYEYQRTAMQWIIDKPKCGLFLDMGLGKTVSTLTAVQQLIDDCDIERVLVVAPKKVAEATWSIIWKIEIPTRWASHIFQRYKRTVRR